MTTIPRKPASAKAAPPTKAPARKAAPRKRAAKATSPQSRILDLVRRSLDDDKAEDLVVIDMAGKSSIADFMVIATGRSQRQLGAMADHLRVKLKGEGLRVPPIEGLAQGDWVLVDAGDVIVHLFRPEVRAFYNLEKMWSRPLADSDDGMAGLVKERPAKAPVTAAAKSRRPARARPRRAAG